MSRQAFSLIELLCVLAVISLMVSAVVPVAGYMTGGNLNLVQTQVQGVLDGARHFAMANRTCVRVGFAEVTSSGYGSVAIHCLQSTSGNSVYDTSDDLNEESRWRSLDKPIVLEGVRLDATLPSRLSDSGSPVNGLESGFTPFQRKLRGAEVEYRHVIQFDPRGQFTLEPDRAVRSAVIGFQNSRKQAVGIILTGATGRVQAFRLEDLMHP